MGGVHDRYLFLQQDFHEPKNAASSSPGWRSGCGTEAVVVVMSMRSWMCWEVVIASCNGSGMRYRWVEHTTLLSSSHLGLYMMYKIWGDLTRDQASKSFMKEFRPHVLPS